MKRSITILLLIFFASHTAFPQAKKAEAILDKVRDKTESYRSIKIEFTYEMTNERADIHESEKGTLLVKGDSYRLDIAGQVVINDGKNIWTYIKEVNEVQINSVDEEDEGIITPTTLLSSYTEDYKPKYEGESEWNGHKVHLIELKPIEDKSYKYIKLKTDSDKDRLLQISIYDKSNNIFQYSVEEFKPNVLFDPNDFTFNAEDYPGVEIIDMRF
jgi:outer membrane lipoprotein-sorting protein